MSHSLEISLNTPTLQVLNCSLFDSFGVQLQVLRLDQMHRTLGGNKWFKLRPFVKELKASELPLAVSFGGAWSNHLRALAAAGQEFGFATLGFVRGELHEELNPVLEFASRCGMEIRYLSRSDYRRKQDPEFLAEITGDIGPHLLIPEGGGASAAVDSCGEIADYLNSDEPTPGKLMQGNRYVALACGTGTTMAGLIRGCARRLSNGSLVCEGGAPPCVIGVPVLKAEGYIQNQLSELLPLPTSEDAEQDVNQFNGVSWQILENYHCGGYARSNAGLRRFLEDFERSCMLPLEPVYSGKLFFAIYDQLNKGMIPAGSRLILVHTGGVHS